MSKHTQFMRTTSYGLVSPGKKANITGIMGEVLRTPSYCRHVASPMVPVVHYGVDLKNTVKLLRKMKKDYEATYGVRKLLPHAQLMVGTVVSYPIPMADLMKSSDEYTSYTHWIKRNILWANKEYGSQLHAIVEHRDETHAHLHIIAIACVKHGILGLHGIHPGIDAERGRKPKERIPAYKRAMKAMQDRYWNIVGLFCGFLRISDEPAFRLTYKQWKRDKRKKEKANEKEKQSSSTSDGHTGAYPNNAASMWAMPRIGDMLRNGPSPHRRT